LCLCPFSTMKACVFASLIAGVAAGGSLKLTWSDCGAKHAKTTDVQPASIALGAETEITGKGAVDEDVSAGSFDAEVKAGGGLIDQHFTGDICTAKTFDLPLGIGKLSWEGVSCPLKKGDASIKMKVKLASALPAAAAKSDIKLTSKDQNGEDLLCVAIHMEKALESSDDFDAYLAKFGKAYNGDGEYEARMTIYNENMKYIKEENAKDHTYTLGETQFTDLTNEEFKRLYVSGYKPASQQLGSDLPYLGEHEETESSGSVDWTTKGAVTPVKNQGQCGSCWSFSTTGSLEGAWQINAGQLVSMSEQQFVDCDKSSMGCNGGSMATAFSWAEKQNVATESSYPYTATDGSCKTSFTTAIPKGGVTGYKSVGSLFSKATVAKLESAIDIGPVSIAIEADQSSFQHYTGGILSENCGTNLDHGVLAVGYNSAEGYWLVKNSWGNTWGDKGYLKIAQAGNVCGILNQPVYPTVSSSVSV